MKLNLLQKLKTLINSELSVTHKWLIMIYKKNLLKQLWII